MSWMKGGGGYVRSFGHEHDFCQAKKAENTDPCANYAVKSATARGHLTFDPETRFLGNRGFPQACHCFVPLPFGYDLSFWHPTCFWWSLGGTQAGIVPECLLLIPLTTGKENKEEVKGTNSMGQVGFCEPRESQGDFWEDLQLPMRNLDGQNRQSPIASVQRARSTLASHSAVPRGTNVKRMTANRAIRIAAQRTQGPRGLISVFLGGDMTANDS